jgi:methyl-accepting chemotaxis protein
MARFATLVAEVAERGLQAIDVAEREVLEDMRQKNVASEAELRAYAEPEAFQMALQKRVGTLPQDDSIAIIDAKGAIICLSTVWPPPPFDLSTRPYFMHAKADPSQDIFLAMVPPLEGDRRPTLFIGRRISAPDGRFLGVILGRINTHYFEDLYRSILGTGDNAIALTLNDGTLALRYPPTPGFLGKAVGGIVAAPAGINALLDNISPLDGARRFAAIHSLAHYPAWITYAMGAAAALAPWRIEAFLLLSAAVLLDGAIIGGVVLTLRQMRIQRRAAQEERLEAAALLQRERDRSAGAIDRAAERAGFLSSLAWVFDQKIGQMSRVVAEAAGQVQAKATIVTRLAGEATDRTQGAATAATSQASGVRAMAEALTALTGSIEGVVHAVGRSTALAGAATLAAEDADATVMTLTAATSQIGLILKLISGIAQQTSMLALNATIEAARAGEAGRGFAVVASEVKTLSKSVSEATETIKHQIGGMQVATTQTAAAMAKIRNFVTTITAIATTTAAAMEDQRKATLQIAGTMVGAADGARTLSDQIGEANGATSTAGATAATVQDVAQTLVAQADALRAASEAFLVQVHAA